MRFAFPVSRGYTAATMEESLLSAVHWLLGVLARPSVGLAAIFPVSRVSATLLPLGS